MWNFVLQTTRQVRVQAAVTVFAVGAREIVGASVPASSNGIFPIDSTAVGRTPGSWSRRWGNSVAAILLESAVTFFASRTRRIVYRAHYTALVVGIRPTSTTSTKQKEVRFTEYKSILDSETVHSKAEERACDVPITGASRRGRFQGGCHGG